MHETLVTDRDHAVLREIHRLRYAPPAALARLFSSRAAAYVRLGLLARRGLVARSSALGQRMYHLTRRGAALVGVSAPRPTAGRVGRSARAGVLRALLASLGYREVRPDRYERPALLWFARGTDAANLLAGYVSTRPLDARYAARLLELVFVRRHTARALILAGDARTRPRVMRDPRYPPALLLPLPPSPEGRALLAALV